MIAILDILMQLPELVKTQPGDFGDCLLLAKEQTRATVSKQAPEPYF